MRGKEERGKGGGRERGRRVREGRERGQKKSINIQQQK